MVSWLGPDAVGGVAAVDADLAGEDPGVDLTVVAVPWRH